MKRVFGYLRVSGKGQMDGDGFDRQRDAINAFAASKGWVVARFFGEEASVSGRVGAMDRSAFAEMMELCGDGSIFDTIVVERADRLARTLIVSELLFMEVQKRGIKLFEAASGHEFADIDDDPTRILIRQVLGALAEWNRSELVKKLETARRRIRRSGKKCEGRKAWEDSNPELANKIVEWIETDCALTPYNEDSPRRGKSSGVIRWLKARNIPPPGGKQWTKQNLNALYKRHKDKCNLPNRIGDRRYLPEFLDMSKV